MKRVRWRVKQLEFRDEPMLFSMMRYRLRQDRTPSEVDASLVSSHLEGSKQHAPIIDLDFPHEYVPSTTTDHAHLYLNVPISKFRLFLLLLGLYSGGVIEKGFFYWSLRRGGTFVRLPGVRKTAAENMHYSYGMLFKLRKKK